MEQHSNRFELVSASADKNVSGMLDVCKRFTPKKVVMTDADAAEKLQNQLKTLEIEPEIRIYSGKDALISIAQDPDADVVMAAIVGAAGLPATLAAVSCGKRVLLANKEALVVSGKIFMRELQENNAELLPVDSEHNAIFQCLPDDYRIGSTPEGVNRIILTGSGGAFLNETAPELVNKTPEEAVIHPNWNMGAKISVDSATMMNKGLEWLEAKWLFNVEDDKLQIVVHPQSVIHSMVEYKDGSILAQLGPPDMKIPIANCLGFPERIDSKATSLDFFKLGSLTFVRPDETRFPALRLTREAWEKGGGATVVLNSANEVAVSSFLEHKFKFTEIVKVVEQTLFAVSPSDADSLNDILDDDEKAREFAEEYVSSL